MARSITEIRQAAVGGDVTSMKVLAGELFQKDRQESEKWFRRAAEAGDAEAMGNLGAMLGERDPQEAERWLRRSAEAGIDIAMHNLAFMLKRTKPVESELWYRRAAELGYADSMHNLGLSLLATDPMEAEQWLRRSAQAGVMESMYRLALLLRERESAEAETWYRQAASLGDARSMLDLGALLQGSLDDPLKPEVKELWERAAEAGQLAAITNLGLCALSTDRAKAEEWFRLAAEHGDAVGMFYVASLSVERGDIGQAAYFWTLAADAGHQEARDKLDALRKWEAQLREKAAAGDGASMYHLAMVFNQLDPDAALSWMRQAAEAGFEPAQQALGADPSQPAAT